MNRNVEVAVVDSLTCQSKKDIFQQFSGGDP